MNNHKYPLEETIAQNVTRAVSGSFGQIFARGVAWLWRLQGDRQAVASLLGRYSAHLGIVLLVTLLFVLGRVTFAQVSVANTPDSSTAPVVAEPVATPTLAGAGGPALRYVPVRSQASVVRQALPHTLLPDRVRLKVITYTVKSGDTIYGIAEQFSLSPYTIVWSNMETLQGAPWHLSPGITLFNPPVDGAYHTVGEAETVSSIAEDYEVEVAALYNMWNSLEPGDRLREGQQLVILDGTGVDFDWEPPPPPPPKPGRAVAAATSYYGNVDVSMTGASGYFMLPTGSYAVSGYTFHDPRNPPHIGLDYTCHLGDLIYAADSGVVIFTGWSGGYGQLVRLDHGNGFTTRYGHFDSIWVTAGQFIAKGSVLGTCGNTGWSTGPHLHYEIRFNGVPHNPRLYEP